MIGCAFDADNTTAEKDPPTLPPSPPPQDPLPQSSGTFAGTYRVPTNADLAQAAQYDLDSITWTVSGSIVTLHYNLPIGLVGGHVPITLTGQLGAGSTQIMLMGDNGQGVCVATAVRVICQEAFAGLGALPVSQAIVEKTAVKDYPGPIADRVTVATVFASDPIGTVDIDLTQPVIDDRGGKGNKGED